MLSLHFLEAPSQGEPYMKKLFSVLLSVLLSVSLLASLLAAAGCGGPAETTTEAPGPMRYDDGRARPSSAGRLQVRDGMLSDQQGSPVMLRGVSLNGLITSESFLNENSFEELSRDYGVNLIRLAMYTYGVGTVGYCTKGDKERHKADIAKGVELARNYDMYVIIDWHILSDGDPNTYKEEAKVFFAEMAELYKNYDNVLYEICNEPNHVDWAACKSYAEEVIPVIRSVSTTFSTPSTSTLPRTERISGK